MARSTVNKSSQSRKANRLKDEVYREMFLLESHRPALKWDLHRLFFVRSLSLSHLRITASFRNG